MLKALAAVSLDVPSADTRIKRVEIKAWMTAAGSADERNDLILVISQSRTVPL